MKKIKYIFLIPLVVLVYFIWNKEYKEREKKIAKLFIEYPAIEKEGKDYHGIIERYTIGSEYTAGMAIYIQLSTGAKFRIYGTSTNTDYKKADLRDNLQVKDSIYYNHKTNELFIYRKNEKYYFILFRDL